VHKTGNVWAPSCVLECEAVSLHQGIYQYKLTRYTRAQDKNTYAQFPISTFEHEQDKVHECDNI